MPEQSTDRRGVAELPAARGGAVSGRLRRLVGRVDADADREDFPRWLTRGCAWLPAVTFVGLVLAYVVFRPAFYTVTREDNVLEWLQFTGLLMTAVLSLVAGISRLRQGQVLLGLALLGLAVATFLIGGEEISWGQRVFALGEPSALTGVNQQQEINFHNVNVGGVFSPQNLFKVVEFLMGVGGAALALAARARRPRLRAPFWQAIAPPLCTVPGYVAMIAYWPLTVVAGELSPVVRLQEWAEMSLYVSLAVTVVAVVLRTWVSGGSRVAWRWVLAVTAVAGLVTVVFAVLTAVHGIVPINARS